MLLVCCAVLSTSAFNSVDVRKVSVNFAKVFSRLYICVPMIFSLDSAAIITSLVFCAASGNVFSPYVKKNIS